MALPGLPSSPPTKTYRNAIQLYEELLKMPTAPSSKLYGSKDDELVEKERGRHRGGIVNAKRKTELCRNWLNGFCAYGDECAFAHGCHDMRKFSSSSDDISSSPDTLSKTVINDEEASYRSLQYSSTLLPAGHQKQYHERRSHEQPQECRYSPCNAYVATGSCQNMSKCNFLHDPRIHGETLIEPCGEAALNDYGSVDLSDICCSPKWPEVLYDCYGGEKMDDEEDQPMTSNRSSTYELNWVTNDTKEAYMSRCMYRMWYGLVESIMEKNGLHKRRAFNGQAAHTLGQLPVLQELKTRLSLPQVLDTHNTGCSQKADNNKPLQPSHVPCKVMGQEFDTQNQKLQELKNENEDVTELLSEPAAFFTASGRESPPFLLKSKPKSNLSAMERYPLQPARIYPGNTCTRDNTISSSRGLIKATNHPIRTCASIAVDRQIRGSPIMVGNGGITYQDKAKPQ